MEPAEVQPTTEVQASAGETCAWPVHKDDEPGNSCWEGVRSYCKFSWYVHTKNGKQHLKDVILDPNNWRAGVQVALVSVPLSISLGIASGTTPTRGLATAIFGGLCAGFFGSSDYNILGPAGALSGMLMSYSVRWGEDVLPWLSLFSAGICLVCGVLRLESYMLLLPKSVLEGFTVGVALIIGLNQVNFACGLSPKVKHVEFILNVAESFGMLGETKLASVILFLVSTPLLFILMKKVEKVPWIVILPVVSIPLGVLCEEGILDFELLTLKTKYGVLKPELVPGMSATTASFVDMVVPSLSIAAVAILETLISAKIAGILVDRAFSTQGEIRGLVVAHAVCGAVGAMPPTGVFVRTSVNTTSGATHRFSQVLNAVIVAIISLAAMPGFSYLPQATIASVLVVCSIRMMPIDFLVQVWHEDKWSLALTLVTAVVCVAQDPVIGLAVGMVMAFLGRARTMMTARFVQIKAKPDASGERRTYEIVVVGALTYVNAETFEERVRKLPEACEVCLNLSELWQIDHDGVEALGKAANRWSQGEPRCAVTVKGISDELMPHFSHAEWFQKVDHEGRLRAPVVEVSV